MIAEVEPSPAAEAEPPVSTPVVRRGWESTAAHAYRPDIDGMRAIAVLMVVAFHLSPDLRRLHWRLPDVELSGGYIGVDVFFVISGYLIGSILLRELHDGSFSILKFYERRIRRIVPALAGVISFCTLASYFNLLPGEFGTQALASLATIASVSNVFFWFKSGYFDTSAQSAPLLHTWSLAVEEQFYLVLPWLLYLGVRYARSHLRAVLAALIIASFAASQVSLSRYPSAAFYLVHSRAWELLLGTWLAMGVPGRLGLAGRNVLSLAGLTLIVVPAFMYSDATPFPGAAALAPCIGACLLIAAGSMGSSIVTWLLACRPVVFVGLISYSLYLWHWPLIVFFDGFSLLLGNPLSTRVLALVILVLAVASWRFIEVPLRNPAARVWRPGVFAAGAWMAGVLVVLNGLVVLGEGLPGRFTPAEQMMARTAETPPEEGSYGPGCFVASEADPLPDHCVQRQPGRPNHVLLGSSYMADKWYGLVRVFPDTHFLQATGANCTTLVDASNRDPWCEQLNRRIFSSGVLEQPLDGVVLSVNSSDLDSLRKTLTAIHTRGLPTVVIGPPPSYHEALPRLLVLASRMHDAALPSRRMVPEKREIDVAMEAIVRDQPDARYVSLYGLLCDGGSCLTTLDSGRPLQRDGGHLTSEGSVFVAKKIRDAGVSFGVR